jgi:nucleoside-diphosphate-sugar epimerase
MHQDIKRALVCGAGGFIGTHLVRRLKREGFWVRGADQILPRYSESSADEFALGDLRDPAFCAEVMQGVSDVYQLAADMGGAGYLFTGENDADIMHNSAKINLNVIDVVRHVGVARIFYASSACVYPLYNQTDPDNPTTAEDSVYPAEPDSDYGWEKLFSERAYQALARNYDVEVHIARLHNIFGPEGSWNDGREKAPAALCRKVAEAQDSGELEIWGDGRQTRSFLYVADCVDAIRRFMESRFVGPVNIGSAEMISINQLATLTMQIAGKRLRVKHVPGPLGVRGRTSDNRLIEEKLGWTPGVSLEAGLSGTYAWVREQVEACRLGIAREPSGAGVPQTG